MLNKANFVIASVAFGEEDDVSKEMKGILVSPTRTIATNGSVAVIVTSFEDDQAGLFDAADDVEPADYFTDFILPKETALKVAGCIPKAKKGKRPAAYYAVVDATTENNERAMLSINDLFAQDILRSKKIDGKFPDVEKLLTSPKGKPKASFMIDPDQLMQVAKLIAGFAKFHKDDAGPVTITFHGGGRTLLKFSIGNGKQEMTAALMVTDGEMEK